MKQVIELRIRILEIFGPFVQSIRHKYLVLKGYKGISRNVIIERGCNFDRVFPGDIEIQAGCLIASRVTILTHEHIFRDAVNPRLPLRRSVVIGENSFVGVGAILLPGTKIGAESIIASGAVVSGEFPPNSLIAGVPGKVVRRGVHMDNRAICIQKGTK